MEIGSYVMNVYQVCTCVLWGTWGRATCVVCRFEAVPVVLR